jgi:mono/diheme cytochrome c family protein
MRDRPLSLLAAAAFLLGSGAPGAAPPMPKHDEALAAAGAELYREHCAMCHGPKGKGDGAMADRLHFAPPDLTSMHRRTQGGFSFDITRRVIDGRKPLKGHGGPEMPVWGDAFRSRVDGYSEDQVQKKITNVVHYLASIQAR